MNQKSANSKSGIYPLISLTNAAKCVIFKAAEEVRNMIRNAALKFKSKIHLNYRKTKLTIVSNQEVCHG